MIGFDMINNNREKFCWEREEGKWMVSTKSHIRVTQIYWLGCHIPAGRVRADLCRDGRGRE